MGKIRYRVPSTRATPFAPILTRYLKLDHCWSSSLDLPNKPDNLTSNHPVISTRMTIISFSNTTIRLQKPFGIELWFGTEQDQIFTLPVHYSFPFAFHVYIINMDVIHAFTVLFSAVLNMLNNSVSVLSISSFCY